MILSTHEGLIYNGNTDLRPIGVELFPILRAQTCIKFPVSNALFTSFVCIIILVNPYFIEIFRIGNSMIET